MNADDNKNLFQVTVDLKRETYSNNTTLFNFSQCYHDLKFFIKLIRFIEQNKDKLYVSFSDNCRLFLGENKISQELSTVLVTLAKVSLFSSIGLVVSVDDELCRVIANYNYDPFEQNVLAEKILGNRSSMASFISGKKIRFAGSNDLMNIPSYGIEPRTYHYIGNKPLLFHGAWIRRELSRTANYIQNLRNNRAKVCIVVGNGPSLNKTNLDLLKGKDVFISNFAIKAKKLREASRFLAITNYLVAEQGRAEFSVLEGVTILTPFWLGYCIQNNAVYFNALGGSPFFSRRAEQYVSWHSTVTHFLLQIVYTLGYDKILLIGVDNTYIQPKDLKEGSLINQKEDDPNHFIPDYFKGLKWQAADTNNMAAMYSLAKDTFENDGRQIINCTVGGKLEVFPRSTLEQELSD